MKTSHGRAARGWQLAGCLVVVGLAGTLTGCDNLVHKALNSPQFRETLVAKARTSCTDAAVKDSRIPDTPEMHKKMDAYCDCFAKEGLGQFSTEELADLGKNGVDKMTPAQSAKMNAAVKSCNAKTFDK